MSSGARTLRLLNRIADERVKVSARKKAVDATPAPSDGGFPEQATMGSAGIIVPRLTTLSPPLLRGSWNSIQYSIAGYRIQNDWESQTVSQTGKMGSSKPSQQFTPDAVLGN